MCGIAGLKDPSLSAESLHQVALQMSRSIEHRGPDDEGILTDGDRHIALAHRRLAIVDLSDAGAQPMTSRDGRYVLVYNGEVYNADELRAGPSLQGFAWRGHSDTEAILESISADGLSQTLSKLNGMFAFALWDRAKREVCLVRDQLGIKPLFYFNDAERWSFASELKSLRAAGIPTEIDPDSVGTFLRYGYVPAPSSIYKNVRKVMPGQIIRIKEDGTELAQQYYSLSDISLRAKIAPHEASELQVIDKLENLLEKAVAAQMVSDVPIGAFLSGGLDSSTVAAMMTRVSSSLIRTYSIGFPDFGFDESSSAAAVAKHLGTDHETMILTGADALSVVPELPDLFDEPFADSSQIPTYLLSRMTRNHVTVALSGDGGDELFGGYNRYLWAVKHWRRLAAIPRPITKSIAQLFRSLPPNLINAAERAFPAVLPPQSGSKLRKIASVLCLNENETYTKLTSQIDSPELFCPSGGRVHPFASNESMSFLDRMRLADMTTYMPDDILQKVDRSSMAVGLETRPVLLDRRLLEFAWTLPEHMLIRGSETKWLLRQVLRRHVPDSLYERPKMGFGVPLAAWLRGPLRPWATDLLSDVHFGGGFLSVDAAMELFADHIERGADHSHALWNILSFAAWYRRWHRALP